MPRPRDRQSATGLLPRMEARTRKDGQITYRFHPLLADGTRAATLSIARNGRLVLARAYTLAEQGFPVMSPHHKLRWASVAKMLMGMAAVAASADATPDWLDRNVIDAITGLRIVLAVDVLEGEADLEVHSEAALRLADQAEIGIVHDDVDVGQLELGADGQFLDQELEVIVA